MLVAVVALMPPPSPGSGNVIVTLRPVRDTPPVVPPVTPGPDDDADGGEVSE
jgi:hypothetical protein